ncbi:MAG TPA: hypothetical protein VGR47_06255 [Terracidiphilus sp.]|nr:hypothetical protein [Terracidiphilus sp.]
MDPFLEEEVKAQEAEKEGISNGKALLIIALLTLPVGLVVWHIGGQDRALTASLCFAMNVLAVGICWDLRKHIWFWGVVVAILALHIPLIVELQWPHQWIPGKALVLPGFVDLAITVGIVRFVQKYVVKMPSSDNENE